MNLIYTRLAKMALNTLSKTKERLFFLLLLGTVGKNTSAENRITIFMNVIAIYSLLATIATYFQLRAWGIEERYLIIYYFIPVIAFTLFTLNALKKHLYARIVCSLLFNFAAWNALIIYGKTFNGYLLFYAALVFNVIAFHGKNSMTRGALLFLTLAGPILADYFSYRKILPITNFQSSQAPLAVLMTDTIIVSTIIVIMLLIEKSLSEKNEKDLKILNTNLEQIVEKRTELLNTAREEAMEASRTKSQFVANTSHELRTPLGAIIGFVDLILENDLSKNDINSYLQIIQRNANQLLQIVNEVLDLSKIEAQKLQIEKETFNLYNFIEEVKVLMSLKAEDKGLIFKFNIEKNLPKFIYTDPLRLKQILTNLIGNAVKFTKKGSVEIHLKYNEFGNLLIFDIIDTGPGITLKNRELIFQPFSQGDSTLMRKYGGTGLGLALSKSLANLLDADLVLLESKIGKGSTFRLTLKNVAQLGLSNPRFSSQKNTSTPSQSLINKRIFAVDDSPDIRFLVSKYLSLAGATVTLADNGQNAVEQLEKNSNYDAILMDLQMPIMDGYHTIEVLTKKGYEIPIIAFTAHAMKEEREKLVKAGFSGCLTKPIDRQHLINTICDLAK